MSTRRLSVLLFLGAAALSGATMLKGIQPNDEGLMLQAASRIAHGEVPYSDFWWFYPPGQPYLLGGLWSIFGPSLLVWRIVRVLCDATVALLAWRLARRAAPEPLALAAWLATALAMAFPSGPHPYPLALAAALGALLCFERSPVGAGVLVGVCAAWRLEFAAFAGLGILAAQAARPVAARLRAATAGRFAGASFATGLLLYAPVVAAAGLRPSWELIVRYPLVDFRAYQQLPLRLSYTDEWAFGSAREILDTLGSVLHFYLPVVLLAGLAAALVALGLRFRRAEHWPRVALAVFAVGMASYLWTRPDYFHAAPLEVALAALAAWAIAGRREPAVARGGALAVAGSAIAALALVWVLADGTDHRVRGIAQATVRLDVPPGDGVRAEPDVARPLAAAVAQVRRMTPGGGPIYVSGARNDLVTAGAPLFYVLAERDNPTRYDIAAPGVLTSAPVQRRIVADLRRARPRVAVRWLSRLTDFPEPNKAGRSSGVRILDDYLAATYRPVRRYGEWEVLERR
ncbi:MAG: hypothetical protein U0T02_08745 [Solirubrobacteraceae bacterium]